MRSESSMPFHCHSYTQSLSFHHLVADIFYPFDCHKVKIKSVKTTCKAIRRKSVSECLPPISLTSKRQLTAVPPGSPHFWHWWLWSWHSLCYWHIRVTTYLTAQLTLDVVTIVSICKHCCRFPYFSLLFFFPIICFTSFIHYLFWNAFKVWMDLNSRSSWTLFILSSSSRVHKLQETCQKVGKLYTLALPKAFGIHDKV